LSSDKKQTQNLELSLKSGSGELVLTIPLGGLDLLSVSRDGFQVQMKQSRWTLELVGGVQSQPHHPLHQTA
jgi:hypothetical protein